MTRIAIIGGGISGLTAAYSLELARKRGAPIDWQLYEASNRLGGIIETTRHHAPEGNYILEGGPDAWVTEKPWARDLAIELGLEPELIDSNDATRKTWILIDGKLQPIPEHMRLMVPEDLNALDNSPLFSASAKAAYANELTRAAELRAAAPDTDESVASFVRRHFGDEVLTTLAAPLLGGVFGGDVQQLSVRAVMPQFVAMEREHGSLIAALQSRSQQRTAAPQPIFTSLRNGMASLTEALISILPFERLHTARTIERLDELSCDHTALATPLDTTRTLLQPLNPAAAALLPTDASSAILVSLAWPADLARAFTPPPGFGFLVPAQSLSSRPESSHSEDTVERPAVRSAPRDDEGQLLACTFVDQKFPDRVPARARILRAFFGGPTADSLVSQPDEAIAAAALTQLRAILGPLPGPTITTVRRLPRSLPQYEVGHLDRIAQLDSLVSQIPGLHLLGNPYRGVGLPDLVRDARAAAAKILSAL
jgi:protoporphyrinogen/coproporphyrinogen III oxidase